MPAPDAGNQETRPLGNPQSGFPLAGSFFSYGSGASHSGACHRWLHGFWLKAKAGVPVARAPGGWQASGSLG